MNFGRATRVTKPDNSYDHDRLSNLPDVLICHILSFLPTKLSVATSILSRRWELLWTNVPNFDFDCNNHRRVSQSGLRFVDTVSNVLLCSNVHNINTFRLNFNDDRFNRPHLNTWIRSIIARNVQTIYIQLGLLDCLPRCLFVCKTLVDLRLYQCGSLPDSIFLPNLKKLHLYYFLYGNNEKLQNLIAGCPVLEELNIEYTNVYDLRSCTISSPTIKWLSVNLVSFDVYAGGPDFEGDIENFLRDYKLTINTPAVRYLVVKDLPSQCFSTGTFNSLVEAKIYLYNFDVPDEATYCRSVLDFVDKVYQVQSLTLSITQTQFVERSYADVTSRFINLTKLELAADWFFLVKILQSADNLQVLILGEVDQDIKWRTGLYPEGRWSLSSYFRQVPKCFTSSLRQVTIHSFECLEVEFELVSIILRYGKVLSVMDIFSRDVKNMKDLEEKLNALRRISAFERESKSCKLQFF